MHHDPPDNGKLVELSRAVAQLGSALDWGSRGRKFKSCQPDVSKPWNYAEVAGSRAFSFSAVALWLCTLCALALGTSAENRKIRQTCDMSDPFYASQMRAAHETRNDYAIRSAATSARETSESLEEVIVALNASLEVARNAKADADRAQRLSTGIAIASLAVAIASMAVAILAVFVVAP